MGDWDPFADPAEIGEDEASASSNEPVVTGYAADARARSSAAVETAKAYTKDAPAVASLATPGQLRQADRLKVPAYVAGDESLHQARAAPKKPSGPKYGFRGGVAAAAFAGIDSDSSDEEGTKIRGPLYGYSLPQPSSEGTTAASSDDGGLPRQGDDTADVPAGRRKPGKFSSAMATSADAPGRRKAGGFSSAVGQASQACERASERERADMLAESILKPTTRDADGPSFDDMLACLDAEQQRDDTEQGHSGNQLLTTDNPNSFLRAKPARKPEHDKPAGVKPVRDSDRKIDPAQMDAEQRPARAVLSHAPTDPRCVVLNWGEIKKPSEESPPDLEDLLRQIDSAAGESGEATAETPGFEPDVRPASSAAPSVDELLARLDGEESRAAPRGEPKLDAMLAHLDAEEAGEGESDAMPGLEAMLAAVDQDEENEQAELDRETFFGLGAMRDEGPDVQDLQGTKRALARLIGRTTDLDVRQVPGLWDPEDFEASRRGGDIRQPPPEPKPEANTWLISRPYAPAGPSGGSGAAASGRRSDR